MRYFASRIKREAEERIYRIYVTDSLYMQGRNQMPKQRYIELLNPKKEDIRTAEEIADDVFNKIGLTMV